MKSKNAFQKSLKLKGNEMTKQNKSQIHSDLEPVKDLMLKWYTPHDHANALRYAYMDRSRVKCMFREEMESRYIKKVTGGDLVLVTTLPVEEKRLDTFLKLSEIVDYYLLESKEWDSKKINFSKAFWSIYEFNRGGLYYFNPKNMHESFNALEETARLGLFDRIILADSRGLWGDPAWVFRIENMLEKRGISFEFLDSWGLSHHRETLQKKADDPKRYAKVELTYCPKFWKRED